MQKWQTIYAVSARHIPSDENTGRAECMPTDESGDAAFAEGRTVRQTTGRAEDGDKTRPNRATDICTADAKTPLAKRRKYARKKLKKEAGR